jgi:tetratricopeptide (TPR) repeat protein
MFHNHFIGRKPQLQELHEKLALVMENHSQFMLITGDAGMGKSLLAQEFSRQAENKFENVLVAQGNCNAQVGSVRAYLPFIEVIAQLTGNVDKKLVETGQVSKNSRRLKDAMGISIKTILQYGPDLIGTFLPAGALISRSVVYIAKQAGLLSKLDTLKEEPAPDSVDKEKLLEQYAKILRTLSKQYPILLILDDLQWADSSSLNLLLYILKKLPDAPIMILGLARAIYAGDAKNSSDAAWKTTLTEIKETQGNIEIDLKEVQQQNGKTFVTEYINAAPNKFTPEFHNDIYQKTAGHPLFLSELLQGLEGDKKIWKDGNGYWNSATEIDWTMLPSRIEDAITDRVKQIDEELRELLAIASVEGITFSVPILAALYQQSEYDILKLLSRKLERRYSIISEGEIQDIDGKWLCQYSFNSALFQQHIYDELSRRERMILHEKIAQTLEEFYGENRQSIANELAWHYNLAGDNARACRYYYIAGLQSITISAYPEAMQSFLEAFNRLEELSDQKELKINIHIQYCNVLRIVKGWQSTEVLEACTQAHDLFRETGATPEIGPFLFNLWASYLVQMDLQRAAETALENIKLGQELDSDEIRIQGHIAMGNTEYWLGNFESCLHHIEHAKALLREEMVPLITERYGQDMRLFILMFSALVSGILGNTAQAERDIQELMQIVETSENQFGLAIALQAVSWHYVHLEESQKAENAAQELINISRSANLPFYDGIGSLFLGWVQATQSNPQSLVTLEHGIEQVGGVQSVTYSLFVLFHSLAHKKIGNPQQALNELQAAIPLLSTCKSDTYLAEIYREIGELMVLLGRSKEAPNIYEKALAIARKQKASLFEKRIERSIHDLQSGR